MTKTRTVSFDEAVNESLLLCQTLPSTEWISLVEALNRTLCSDIVCQKNLPSFNNAAMDGFAIRYADKGKTLRIRARILAGQNVEACLTENECYKIMTGAKVPSDTDTIIPFEECLNVNEYSVDIPLHVKKGNALRLKGEEQSLGSVLLSKGEQLNSSCIALLASQGITHVAVYRRLNIAVLSTGDELKKPWENASEDEIYDVNAFALISLLKEFGFDAKYVGVVPDDLEIATTYFHSLKAYDVIISSGGVSMGEADFVEKALVANGFQSSFHGINIKPGKPTMMGLMGNTIVASMPGNPLAAYVNAFIFLIPLLRKKEGNKNFTFQYTLAKNISNFDVRSGRVNIVLGKLHNGTFNPYNANKYGSGMITPLIKSSAILLCDEATMTIKNTQFVKILPFNANFTEIIEIFKN